MLVPLAHGSRLWLKEAEDVPARRFSVQDVLRFLLLSNKKAKGFTIHLPRWSPRMGRPSLKSTILTATLLLASAGPSAAQQFEYTPYKGSNNTGQPDQGPPPDNYTPTHQGGVPGAAPPNNDGAGAAPAYQGGAGQDSNADTYDDDNRSGGGSGDAYSAAPPSSAARGDVYTPPPPRGAYSPSEDVYSPSRAVPQAPPLSPPPRGVGGPPIRDGDGGLPRVEVQSSAPDDSVPYAVREHDARRAAIEGWRSKVADRYGPEFSQWRIAIDKRVDCHPDRRDGLVCTASAQPARGFDR